MLYGDIFELDEDVNSVLCSGERKFYKLYSALMQCHAIVKDKHLYEHTLHDIQTMRNTERILEISYLDVVHIFTVESLMNSTIKRNSIVMEDTEENSVEIIPTQLRSMITDGTIDPGK